MPADNQDPTESAHTANTEEITASSASDEQPGPPSSSAESPEPQEAQASQEPLPPEAQGEVNGGPLGCCLGVAVGLVISLSVAVIGRIYANGLLPVFHSPLLILILLRIVMVICGIAGAIIFGYLGWKIGKRLYREYEPPVIKPRRKTLGL